MDVVKPIDDELLNSLKKHSEFWLQDGSIVILTDIDEPAYKIHRTLLQRRSTFFRDFLTPASCEYPSVGII